MTSKRTERQRFIRQKAVIKWRENNPKYQQNRHLVRYHGITPEEYEKLLDMQDGKCAICDSPSDKSAYGRLTVDHDHQIQVLGLSRVRGLLCNRCNSALGLFLESPNLLFKAAEYLLNFQFLKGKRVPSDCMVELKTHAYKLAK